MNYAIIKPFDVANGPGIRTSLFVSGCRHACKGVLMKKYGDLIQDKNLQMNISKK